MQILAVVGSVTVASALLKEMERNGCINCRVVHTPVCISGGGCSYSVKFDEACMKLLKPCIQRRRIKLRGIYKEILKEGEYIYDDIS